MTSFKLQIYSKPAATDLIQFNTQIVENANSTSINVVVMFFMD